MAPDTATSPASAAAPGVAAQRAGLAALRARGERYPFLDQAWRYLAGVPNDPPMVMEVFKALVELGLGGPARELLRHRGDLTGPQLDLLRDSIKDVPTGRVPWEALDGTFDANMSALREHQPHVTCTADQLRAALDGFQLHRSCDGRLHVSRRETGGPRTWMPCLTDHAVIEAATPAPEHLSGSLLIIGLHFNAFADSVHRDSAAPPGQAVGPLYLVETQLHQAAAWLHVADRTAILGDPRVYAFLGPDAAGEYMRLLVASPDIEPPKARFGCFVPDQVCTRFDEAGLKAIRKRETACTRVTAKLTERAAARPPRHLEPGARVIGFTSRFSTMVQYSMRDIGDALQSRGYEFSMQIEAADHCTSSKLVVADAIEAFDPDLIVLINHFRHEMPEPMVGVPVLTWIQDPTETVLSRTTGDALGPLDFVCGYFQRRCTEEFGYPIERFFPAPLPVSTRIFCEGPADPDHECDAVYVGHRHDDPESLVAKWRDAIPPALHPLLEQLRSNVVEIIDRGEHFEQRHAAPMIDQAAAEAGLQLPPALREQLAGFLVHRLFDIMFRRRTLEWVASWAGSRGRRFRLYGRGWADDPVLGEFAAGEVTHGEDLARVYRGARLCIQTIPGGLKHQRALEALACGSLVLGRYVPPDFGHQSLERYRADGRRAAYGSARTFPRLDEVVFHDAAEFAALAELYLGEPDRRRAVQQEFAGVVRSELSYDAVTADVLGKVRDALGV